MKAYFAPDVEIVRLEEQDVVCVSRPEEEGLRVGNGGDDINNWYFS